MHKKSKKISSERGSLKEIEKELRESEERYRVLVEQSPNNILIHDLEGKILFTNASRVGVLGGQTPDDIIGRNAMEFVHPDDLEFVQSTIMEALEEYKNNRFSIKTIEHRFIRLDGSVFHGEATGVPFVYEGELAVQVVIRDITERKQTEEALKESLHRHRALFENMLSAAAYHKIVLDEDQQPVDYIFLEVNNAFEKYTGLKKEDVLGKSATEVIPGIKGSKPDLISIYGEVALTGKGSTFDLYFSPFDKWYSVSAYCPAKGFFVTTFYDITERKLAEEDLVKAKVELEEKVQVRTVELGEANKALQAEITERKQNEEALRESEERFRTIFDSARDGFYVIDLEGRYKAVNDAGCAIFGYTREELLNSDVRKLFFPEDSEDVFKKYAAMWTEGGFISDLRLRDKEGVERYVDITITPLHIGGEDFALGIVRDITERKLTKEALGTSETKYRTLFESSTDAIMLLDKKAFFDCNEATLQMFGRKSKAEFIDKHLSELSPPNQPDGSDSMTLANELIATAYREGNHQFEWMHKRLDGTEFPAEVWLTRMELDGRDVLQATVRDITERKRAEEERESLQEQLIQAQKMEAIGTLAGGVAHDFNNIMTAIKNLNSLAISKTGEKDLREKYLEPIRDVSGRAINLVQQLLIFSEAKSVKLATFNLNDTIDNLLDMLISLVNEDISIEKNLGHDLWNIDADEGRIEQIITNLIVNSRAAMPQGGNLTLRTENVTLTKKQSLKIQGATPGNFVCLTIEDTGTGIDEDKIGHIFEPFFTTRAPNGTGLGLSVVYGIVKELNGWINVSSELGQGAKFRVYLPSSIKTKKVAAEDPIKRKAVDGGGKRILLVEDDKWVRKSTAMLLSENGYKVFEAANAENAISIFYREKGRFDLVLSDVVMPGKSGLQMVDPFLDINPGISVLLFSGHLDEKAQTDRIIKRGFAYIQKPYEITDLLKAVEETIAQGS